MEKGKTATVPEGCEDTTLTVGKEYPIKAWHGDTAFTIEDNEGRQKYCLVRRCWHIGCRNWIIK